MADKSTEKLSGGESVVAPLDLAATPEKPKEQLVIESEAKPVSEGRAEVAGSGLLPGESHRDLQPEGELNPDQSSHSSGSEHDDGSVAEDPLIGFLHRQIDYNLEKFHSSMWGKDEEEKLRQMLANCVEFFVSVRENGLEFSEKLPTVEQISAMEEDNQFIILKKLEPAILLTEENVRTKLIIKSFYVKNFLNSLIEEMTKQVIPVITADKHLPENLKKDLVSSSHKFISNLLDLKGKQEKRTIFYVPVEDLSAGVALSTTNEGKELIHRLEIVVTQWSKQVKEMTSTHQTPADSDMTGSMEEIEFWSHYRANFANIKSQMDRPEVVAIIRLLSEVSPQQYNTFKELIDTVEHGSRQAEENLKFLHILEGPCRELQTAPIREIPAILQRIFFCLRMMWEKCAYYRSEEKTPGLFRKVSNEIIKRCSKSISLELLFEGNVMRCSEELANALEISRAWKEVYRRNERAMKEKWSFQADSVMAQIDAFIQRCNDLSEICECQIQFARSGLEKDMPIFSGNKAADIVSVLEEIRENFNKHLDRLRQKNSKILDIKSTKWHDEYNFFKAGMKNLDNMYINLINFAFDNVVGVQQVVEYMVAFSLLAKRESIDIHVKKKMERVNEIVLNEIHAIDALAKMPPSTSVFSAKYSAKALWVHSLQLRLQSAKALYDKLANGESAMREKLEGEYLNLENYLKMQTNQSFKEFKESFKDFDLTITRRLDQNILIESDDVRNKLLAANKSVSKKLKVSGKGHIQNNFDKQLLTFMTELEGFQKLQTQDVPSFGQKSEEFLAAHREKLRVYRENVMQVVRDYNEILDFMDAPEMQMFSEHLDGIKSSIARGLKILKWSSQGIIDNFVKECRTKCAFLKSKLQHFKDTQDKIRVLVKEMGSSLKVIEYDSRKVQELSTFLSSQQDTHERTALHLNRIMDQIVELLMSVYKNFIDKTERVQRSWFDYVHLLDESILEELQAAAKANILEFLSTICGEEKSKTNPTQIFKVYIVLNTDEKAQGPDFEPAIPTFLERLSECLEDCFSPFDSIVRLPVRTFEERQKLIEQLKEALSLENGSKKNSFHQKKPQQFIELPDDFIDQSQYTFTRALFKAVSGEIGEVNKQLHLQTDRLMEQLLPWKKNSFLHLFSPDYKSYGNSLLEKGTHIDILRKRVQSYDELQNEIQEEKSGDDQICIQIDTSRIKSKLTDLNYEEQKSLLTRIKEKSIDELRGLIRKFLDSEKALSTPASDLKKIKESMELWEMLNGQVVSIEEGLGPLEDRLRLLDDYMTVFKDEETKMRVQLRDSFDGFVGFLKKVRVDNEVTYETFKKDHNARLEEFEREIREKREALSREMPVKMAGGMNYETAYQKISGMRQYMSEIHKQEQKMEFAFVLFKQKYTPIPDIGLIDSDISILTRFWNLREVWDKKTTELSRQLLSELELGQIEAQVSEIRQKLEQLPKATQEWEVSYSLLNELGLYANTAQLLAMLKQPFVQRRHWEQIKECVKENFEHTELTFGKALQLNFEKLAENIREIHDVALAENKIEQAIANIRTRWEEENLVFEPIASLSVSVVQASYGERVAEKLEENLIELGRLKTNAHAMTFLSQIDQWDADLNLITETLEALMIVQRKFVYFNNIFQNLSQEIGQLVADKNAFNTVKTVLVEYLDRFEKQPNTKRCMLTPGFKDAMLGHSEQLDVIQRNMRRYLEGRRGQVPRLYFLSDEDIFEILGKSRDPQALNKHVKKMFEGVKALGVAGKGRGQEYTTFSSPEEETLSFLKGVEIDGDVNATILGLEREIEERLRRALGDSLATLEKTGGRSKDRVESWLQATPGQICLLSAQIEWTQKCLHCFFAEGKDPREGGERAKPARKARTSSREQWTQLKAAYAKYFSELVTLVGRTTSEAAKKKLVALITIETHMRDLLEPLSNASQGGFEWQQQLRFSRTGGPERVGAEAQQGLARFDYLWEYQGICGRLVVTPLTDKCYLTLTTAMAFNRGGNPQGPAGTGKTETVKDLGRNLGRNVFVFNCSEGLDARNVKELFEGLAQTGFWGCFDEFNRIQPETLSAVALQLSTLLDGLSSQKNLVFFEGKEIRLHPACAFFVTMNPGYGGRSELADNLKALFRPISMVAPDLCQICRITLQAYGFVSAELLARKVEAFYALMRSNLSPQDHYDFGLRAIKSVIDLAGSLKRRKDASLAEKKETPAPEKLPELERKHLIAAVQAMSAPKLVSADLALFEALLKDVFIDPPEVQTKEKSSFEAEADRALTTLRIDRSPYFLEKLHHLYETKNARHGCIVIGASFSGKSTLRRVLRATQAGGKTEPRVVELNPKALGVDELYGRFDPRADEIIFGAFGHVMDSLCNKEEFAQGESWIVFDGPIDTKWIESMNSLLDDNRVLTLPNGGRINLRPNVRLLFEVDELKQASPATVSRCGIVYLDARELDGNCIKSSWLFSLESAAASDVLLDCLEELTEKWLDSLIAKRAQLAEFAIAPLPASALVKNSLFLFERILGGREALLALGTLPAETLPSRLEKPLVYAVIWTVGAGLSQEGRVIFDAKLRDIESLFPFVGSVFDYGLSVEKNEFFAWEERLSVAPAQWRPPERARFDEFFVETVEVARFRAVAAYLLEAGEPLLVVGAPGVGKSTIMRAILKAADESGGSYGVVTLSASTSSAALQEQVEAKLSRKNRKKLRPLVGTRAILFLDDVALPRLDEFGYVPALELLRQALEFGGWFDRQALDIFIEQKDIFYVGAMRDSQTLPPRLANKFFALGLPFPNDASLARIFGSILHFGLADFDPEEVKPLSDRALSFVIGLHKNALAEPRLQATPSKPHYLFSLRDIARVVKGVLLIDKLNCDSKSVFRKLLVHEVVCVYQDRLVSAEDRAVFRSVLSDQFYASFEVPLNDALEQGRYPIFSLFVDNRGYSLVSGSAKEPSTAVLRPYLTHLLDTFNGQGRRQLNIVLFEDAIEDICKISRVLNTKEGHLLLVGEGGTGRHSLVKLAASAAGIQVLEPRSLSAGGTFKTELRGLFESVFFSKAETVMLLDEASVKSDDVFSDVSAWLLSREVPGLFARREGRDDFAKVREKLKEKYSKEPDEQLFEKFYSKVRKRLHVACCIGSTGAKLRRLTRNFNGLVYGTTAVFFEDWPLPALTEVASRLLPKSEKTGELAKFFAGVHIHIREEAARLCRAGRAHYVTPKNFIDFCQLFGSLLAKKSMEVEQRIEKYATGLAKLEEAKKCVEELKAKLDIKKLEMSKKSVESRDILFQLEQEKKKIEKDEVWISEKEAVIQKEAQVTSDLFAKAESQLAEALPALEAANEKVNSLDNAAIADIKSFLKLKDKRLELIMFSIMILLKEKPDWATVQKVVADPSFLKRMREIEKDKIGEDRIQKLEKFTKQPEIQGSLESYSKSVNTLLMFVKAIENYVKMFLDVEPIKKKVKKLRDEQASKLEELDRLKTNLELTKARNAELAAQHEIFQVEYNQLMETNTRLEQQLERSEKLVAGLIFSQEAWEDHRKRSIESQKKVEGSVLQAAIALIYFGPFPSEFRAKIRDEFIAPGLKTAKVVDLSSLGVPLSSFLVPDAEILRWQSKGLPGDQVSIENGLIVHNCRSWPLIIDPQSQARVWLRNMEEDNRLVVVEGALGRQFSEIQRCVTQGLPLMVQNIGEELDDALEPLLLNVRKVVGGRTLLMYGEDAMEIHPNFRMYLFTRNSKPRFAPPVFNQTTVIDFSVRQKGLEEQILSVLLRVLDEKLENQRIECIRTKADCDDIRQKLENEILGMLQETSSASLVDSQPLINTLQQTREKEEEVKEILNVNANNAKKNRLARENYQQIGYIVSLLYFAVSGMEKIDPVYQFPLERFLKDFETLLAKLKENKADFADSLPEKVRKIDQAFRRKLYKNCSAAMFEKDRLLLGFVMATTVAPFDARGPETGRAEETKKKALLAPMKSLENTELETGRRRYFEEDFAAEFDFFVRPKAAPAREQQESNPEPGWISPDTWDMICELNRLPNFQGLQGSFMHNTKEWRRYFTSAHPETEPLPSDWSQKIRDFSLLLVIRALRPDRLIFAVQNFVRRVLGAGVLVTKPFALARLLRRAARHPRVTPVLLLLGPGIDALPYVEQAAKKEGRTVVQLTAGRRDSGRDRDKIEQCINEGSWVFAANLHLFAEKLREVEAVLPLKAKPGFQLIVSCRPDAALPLNLLQNCEKATIEPIKGLRANMQRLVNNLLPARSWGARVAELAPYKRVAFGVCWFHALLNERRRFGSLGWNGEIAFSDADFVFAERLVCEFLAAGEQGEPVQWEALRHLLADVAYGGRVTDVWDQRALSEHANEVFREELISDSNFALSRYREDSEFRPPADSHKALLSPKLLSQPLTAPIDLKPEFLGQIDGFPEIEEPAVFGQHSNAEVTIRIEDSKSFARGLQALQPIAAGASADPDQESRIFSLLEVIRSKLPARLEAEDFVDRALRAAKGAPLAADPLACVAAQEASRLNQLLALVGADLVDLELALRGKALITDAHEELLQALVAFRVPRKWGGFFRSAKPLLAWLADIDARFSQMSEWLSKGGVKKVWLGGLLYPGGYLTALLQAYARRNNLAVDSLKFDFVFLPSDGSLPPIKDGAYIHKLFLEGGKWDFASGRLVDSDPMILNYPMPVVHFRPVDKSTKPSPKASYYNCPCYFYPVREGTVEKPSFVMAMPLPFSPKERVDEAFWVKRGTAILLSI